MGTGLAVAKLPVRQEKKLEKASRKEAR